VQLTVTNNGNGYGIACTGADCGGIFSQVQICATTTCVSGTDYNYTIKLDMLVGDGLGNQITNVNYTSNSIDNGQTIDGSCGTTGAVTPTSQSWTRNDTTFPCSYDCTTDTSVTITYQ
jgi:hypothetical protein